MRRTTLLVALVALTAAVWASAELSQTFKDWPNGPEGFLMTAAEKKAYADLKTDAEAQAFIDLFWAKRDPNLDTVFNEFKADFDQRVSAADSQFTWDKAKGSVSDRGKVLILMGLPSGGRQLVPAAQNAVEGRPESMQLGDTDIWAFKKPDAKDPKDFLLFVFQETRPGMKDFLLDRGDSRNKAAIKLLAARPDEFVRNPKLTEVPRAGLLNGSKAATSAQIAILETQPRPWPAGARSLVAPGLQSENVHTAWLHLELPDAVAPATTAIGRVTKADGGQVVGTFAAPATALSIQGARAYQFSIPLEAGKYKIEIALANDAGALAVAEWPTEVEPCPASGPYFTPLYYGVDIRQKTDFRAGDPFIVGGWHVIPRASGNFVSTEQLGYFCYITKPALDEQGKPALEMAMKLFVDDKPGGELPGRPIQLSQVAPNLWMFGNGVPLQNFSRPATYKLELTIRDTKANASRTTAVVFTIPKPEGAAAPAAK